MTEGSAALRRYLDFAVHSAELAGREILRYFRCRIEVHNKATGGFDPVTAADRAAEAIIRAEIRREFPDHGIVGEEHGSSDGASPMYWLIDPIDGTRAFITGQLHWGTLIALNDGERPIVGVMHQPYVGETFAGSSLGAELRYRDGIERLATRPCARLEEAVLCTTDPIMYQTPAERRAFERLASQVRMVRYGGDCYTPCLLAAGQIDLVIEAGLKAFDIQPLVPIVAAAGATVTDWSGGSPLQGGQVLFSGDPSLHAAALEILAGE